MWKEGRHQPILRGRRFTLAGFVYRCPSSVTGAELVLQLEGADLEPRESRALRVVAPGRGTLGRDRLDQGCFDRCKALLASKGYVISERSDIRARSSSVAMSQLRIWTMRSRSEINVLICAASRSSLSFPIRSCFISMLQ